MHTSRVQNGWAAAAVAAAGVVLGFILAAGTFSFGGGEPGAGAPAAGAQGLASVDVSARTDLTIDEKRRIAVFERASPSVVFISTSSLVEMRRGLFHRNVMKIPRGNGTGFVWGEDGHIVTNYHVTAGNPSSTRYSVVLQDNSEFEAKRVGAYPQKDLAVLKIDAPRSKLRPIRLGSSSDLLVGQTVLAIGNPFGLDQTLTTGVVSALSREIVSPANTKIINVIQTDAAINPGNSGGPLLDSSGRLIGVNTMIISPSQASSGIGQSAGIGFAVPADTVRKIIPQLIEYGQIVRPYHPVLGVELDSSASERIRRQSGLAPAVVAEVTPGSGAEEAGLQPKDIIVEADGNRLRRIDDLRVVLERHEPGDVIEIKYVRDDDVKSTKIRLSGVPEEP